MSPNTNRPIHGHICHSDVGMSRNNDRSSINNTTGKQGSIEISTSTQYHDTAQQQDTRELNDNAVRLATLAEGTTHDTPQVATTTTTIATSSWTRDDDKDEQLDPSEKERRRQARAFEQQQRILQQVEAARRLQLANTPKKKKNNNRDNTKKLIQKSTPDAHHLETKAIPLSTTGKCTASDETTTPNNAFHEDTDKFLPAEGRQQQQQERPPRTKGLLYRRLTNGYLVPIESRPWTGTTQNKANNHQHHHRLASNRTKPNQTCRVSEKENA